MAFDKVKERSVPITSILKPRDATVSEISISGCCRRSVLEDIQTYSLIDRSLSSEPSGGTERQLLFSAGGLPNWEPIYKSSA